MHVVCLGDPVMDVLAHVNFEFLQKHGLHPGGCEAVDSTYQQRLLSDLQLKSPPQRSCGGSAANVAKGLAGLGSAHRGIGFAGRVGKTREYEEGLQRAGVDSLLCRSDSEDTATCVCLVTPDGERTMRTNLGAAAGLTDISQLPEDWLEDCELLHLEGYILYKPQLLQQVLEAAKRLNILVTLDLGSMELIQHNKATLLEALETRCIHIVFCNKDEAGCVAQIPRSSEHEDAQNEEVIGAAQDFLLRYCQISVVSLGPKGCLVKNVSGDIAACPAAATKVVDTVGAGDYFTAGFLHGFLAQKSLQECASWGCRIGSASVTQSGADFAMEAWREWKACLTVQNM